jgi:tRNA (mo5U34)-methyltransferase
MNMVPTLFRLLGRRSKPRADRAAPAASVNPAERSRLQALVDAVPGWWHSIDLGHGVVTPGRKTPAVLRQELDLLRLPELRGKSVLDIGAWDGFYSFEAERRGASRVVALDHFAWVVNPLDPGGHARYLALEQSGWQEAARQGALALPGKKGFDTARQALGSKVETVVDDFMTVDVERLGTFDVVLFLGVLYHMKEPLRSLQRLAALTRELAVIETAGIVVPGKEETALCEFYETTELQGDPTNWWAPNEKALVGMARAAGFRKVEITSPPLSKQALALAQRTVLHRRLTARAWK